MTKSELRCRLSRQLVQHPLVDIEVAVNVLLDQLTEQLAAGGRIEIRGFGAFSIRYHAARWRAIPEQAYLSTFPSDMRRTSSPGRRCESA
jgi:nucleoid DNA-binding protein